MLSARQIRAARGLLGWNQEELSKKAGIARVSVKNIETGVTTPRRDTLESIYEAFQDYGVEFMPNDGVRMQDATIHVFHGIKGFKLLLDKMYETVIAHSNKEILIANNTEPYDLGKDVMDYLNMHLERINKAGIRERILCCEGDTNFVGPLSSYRWVPKEHFYNSPTFIFGDKVAMLIWGPPTKITLINDPQYAISLRNLFMFAWGHARIPEAS